MIYWYSGTGNSRMVAQELAALLGDKCSMMTALEEHSDELVGLVFPVYGWGMPRVVQRFVNEQLKVLCNKQPTYVFAVMTCGDDMGYADRLLDKLLQSSLGVKLSAAFSVQMPNTYVCLPGMDVDSDERAAEKVHTTRTRLAGLADDIRNRLHKRELVRGGAAWLKTYVIRPVFDKWLVTDKYFKVDAEKCISCGKCEHACPVKNIQLGVGESDTLSKKMPSWNHQCVGCLACYHACPQHAIHFGKQTLKKGQWKGVDSIK